MVKLFNAKARQIPIGEYETFGIRKSTRARPGFPPPDRRHVAAVDAIHTSLPVLWRAHAETGDDHAGRELQVADRAA